MACHRSRVHDNSIALVDDGNILFAEAEERISRVKHDERFPYLALKEALKVTKTKISDIDYFVSATPDESLLRKFLATIKFIPYVGFASYFKQIFSRFFYKIDKLPNEGRPMSIYDLNIPSEKFITVSHYLAHAISAYHSCLFDRCLVVAMDGYGPGEKGEPLSGKIYLGSEGKLVPLEDIPVEGSLGLYYGFVTKALGFKLNDGEGKTMGLAAYGDPSKCYFQMKKYFANFDIDHWIIRSSIMDILNVIREEFFEKSKTLKYLRKLIKRYGKENVAASCQMVFEEELEKYVRYLVNKYKIRKVAAAGGIFLNVKANMRLLKNKLIDELFIYPNPADGGTAMGAAMAGFLRNGKEIKREELLHSAYGRSYSNSEILKELKEAKGVIYKKLDKELAKKTAKLLVDGKVVGWFQGKGEWGPRALGQRSVIADPRYIKTKNRINDILKGREWFMPFAPSMLIERAPDYLKTLKKAPFMIIADDIKRSKIKDIRAVIHVDKTARPQLVTKKANPLYYHVIKEFEKITGVGAILNTSFNKHGLPIVYSPKDAVEHLLWKTIDILVMGDYLVERL